MKLLMLHPNMPGQYRHLLRRVAADGEHEIVFLTRPDAPGRMEGVRRIDYARSANAKTDCHDYLKTFQDAVYESQAVWRICAALKQKGFVPDLIMGHLGWGQGLYLKDIFPNTPILSYFEYFYGADRAGADFLPGMEMSLDGEAKLRTRNAHLLMDLTYSDWGVTPTEFQKSRYPALFHDKMSVLHDGVDTSRARPDSQTASVTLPSQHGAFTIRRGDPVVTYVARDLEPYRGFPTFARAAAELVRRRPDITIVCVGGDAVSYGAKLPGGVTFREVMHRELGADLDAVRFTGRIEYQRLIELLRLSRAHIYLTVPFVLSWSILEAMACGAPLIASDTAPVREVVEDGRNGVLTDFFDADALVDRVLETLSDGEAAQKRAEAAREDVVRKYDFDRVLPLHLALMQDMARNGTPDESAARIEAFNQAEALGEHHPHRDRISAPYQSPASPRQAYIPHLSKTIAAIQRDQGGVRDEV